MSKQYLKGVVSGIIISFLLTTVVFASTKTIDVLFNGVNIEVNGQKVAADNLLYNGTTYVPLRVIAEMLGMEVGWIQQTNTATLKGKTETHIEVPRQPEVPKEIEVTRQPEVPKLPEAQKSTEEPKNIDAKSIKLVSSTSPFTRGSEASLTIEGAPKARYTIAIADPTMEGLEAKEAGEDGRVTWTWKVSPNASTGNYVITIIDMGSGQVFTTILIVK